MSRKIQVRMMVGLGETDTTPTVAGCIDGDTWEIIDPAEVDRKFAAMRNEYLELDPTMAWREVAVTLDADALLAHFNGPVLEGEIQAA